jgi:hypothetical protein
MVAQIYRLTKSLQGGLADVKYSASALVYAVVQQIVKETGMPFKDLEKLFDLIVVSMDDVIGAKQIAGAQGIYCTTDEFPVVVRQSGMPPAYESMYFSKPLYDKETGAPVYVSHQWSKWLNHDGSKRARGYSFFCIESFIHVVGPLGFEVAESAPRKG